MFIEFIIQFSEIKFFQFSNQKQFENSFFTWIKEAYSRWLAAKIK